MSTVACPSQASVMLLSDQAAGSGVCGAGSRSPLILTTIWGGREMAARPRPAPAARRNPRLFICALLRHRPSLLWLGPTEYTPPCEVRRRHSGCRNPPNTHLIIG